MFSQRLLPKSIVIPSRCCAGSVVCLNNNVGELQIDSKLSIWSVSN
jgi:hypothetical protein